MEMAIFKTISFTIEKYYYGMPIIYFAIQIIYDYFTRNHISRAKLIVMYQMINSSICKEFIIRGNKNEKQ
jgi:hypothetical protein